MIGRELGGRYTLLQELGRGATAVVYRARDKQLQTDIAVKLLAPHLATDPAALARMQREALAARQIASDAVAQVYDLGRDGGQHYLAMEYCPTGTLRDHLLLHGPLTPVLLDRLMEQLAAALAACHRRGILHRDLKPSNILFDPQSGSIKLIDFGVARVADAMDVDRGACIVGTPEYMAPEQFSDPIPDPRSDLYAAGVVLFEAATGRPPITGRSLPEIIRKHRDGVQLSPRQLNPSVGVGMEAIILKLLQPDPAERFQSTEELLRVVSGKTLIEPASESRHAVCPECGAKREMDLPFCPMCAKSLEEFDRFGRWSIQVAAPWDDKTVARVLDTCLPSQAVRFARPARQRRTLHVVEFTSEHLARWLAERLRRVGLDASTRRLTLVRSLLALGVVAFVVGAMLQDVLMQLMTLAALQQRPGRAAGPVIFRLLSASLLLLSLAAYSLYHVRARFGRAMAFITPLPRPTQASDPIERARLAQSGLQTTRCRSIGCNLLLSAHRLAGRDAARNPRRETLLDSAFQLLLHMDQQTLLWQTQRESSDARARRQDALVKATHLLLRIIASWRDQRTTQLRAVSQRLSRAVEQVGAASEGLDGAAEQIRDVMQELNA